MIITAKNKDRGPENFTMHRGEKEKGEQIYNQRQRFDRFKKYTKRKKHEIDIGPLITEELLNAIEWNTEEIKI